MLRHYSSSLFAILFVCSSAFAQSDGEQPLPPETESLVISVDAKPACPRRGCWAVTMEALHRLSGVQQVDMELTDSTLRRVRLTDAKLPDPTVWKKEFQEYVGTASQFRGVVVTMTGTIVQKNGHLAISVPDLELVSIKLLNRGVEAKQSNDSDESDPSDISGNARITGLLQKDKQGYSIEVSHFEILPATTRPAPEDERR